jgi:hypothetical protein
MQNYNFNSCFSCVKLRVILMKEHSPPLARVSNQLHPVHTVTSYFSNFNFNIILPSAPRLPSVIRDLYLKLLHD